jgi:hypothetical protein
LSKIGVNLAAKLVKLLLDSFHLSIIYRKF